jgi:hypothetical protein
LFAKQLLLKWLRESEVDGYEGILPFRCRRNYGFHMELPFYEKSDPYYFELSSYVDIEKAQISSRSLMDYETIFDQKADRGKLLFVPDICGFHKGSVTQFIEVVHTSPLTDKKRSIIAEFMRGYYYAIGEVDAEWILRQTKTPTKIRVTSYNEY